MKLAWAYAAATRVLVKPVMRACVCRGWAAPPLGFRSSPDTFFLILKPATGRRAVVTLGNALGGVGVAVGTAARKRFGARTDDSNGRVLRPERSMRV